MALHERSIDLDPDFHQKSSLYCLGGPISPASFSERVPPCFIDSVRTDLLEPSTEQPFADAHNRACEMLLSELGRGQISTYEQVESFVKRRVSQSHPEPSFNSSLNSLIFSARCRGAQAMYNSRKVSWLLDHIRRAAHHHVLPVGGGGVIAAYQTLPTNVDPRWTHELNGFPNAPPSLTSDHTASSTPLATTRTRKRKRRESQQHHTPEGVASQRSSKCPLCDETFSGIPSDQRSNLRRHFKQFHSGPGQYVCRECNGQFARSDYLLYHCRVVHNFR
jgi:hypothetical protein